MSMSRSNQKGMSAIGFLVFFIGISFVALLGMRIIPAYVEFMSVERAFNAVRDSGAEFRTSASIRKALTKRFIVDSVRTINSGDVKVDTRGEKIHVWIDYEVRVHIVSNIDAVVSFNKEMFISRSRI